MATKRRMNAEAILPDLSQLNSDESNTDTENELEDWPGQGRNCLSPEIRLQTRHQISLEDGKSVSNDSDSDSFDLSKMGANKRSRRLGHQPSTSTVHQSNGNLDSDNFQMDADDLDANRLMSMLRSICDTVKENTRCLKELQKAQAEFQHSR